MNYEENRLNTFGSWPTSAAIEPIRIAKAGFYFTGRGVEVQCFSCGGKISEWSYGDQAMARHRRLDPRCPFVVDPAASGNVALVLGRPCARANGPGTTRTNSETAEPSTEDSNPLEMGPTLNNDDEIYRNDALRLLSFINWPVRFISRESLASAGFYHAGGGRVRCAWCGGELCGGWRQGDRPLDEHRRHFPHCWYARMAGGTTAPEQATAQRSQPDTPPAGSPQQEDTLPQTEAVEHNCRILEELQWRGLGVVGGGAEGARHPARASLASRLATYTNWPSSRRQTPPLLAEAGFYYTGSEDQVRCFYCDGGLGKWEPSDAPWCEHARWFPDCGYVMLIKGRDFIERCRYRGRIDYTPEEDPSIRRRRSAANRVRFPISEDQVESEMESGVAMAALGTGLDVARVRSAIRRRLRNTGVQFTSSEALIDAALNEQLNEESWSATPTSQRLARDILSETLRNYSSAELWADQSPSSADDRSVSPADSLNTPVSAPAVPAPSSAADKQERHSPPSPTGNNVSLEEENRQLREARLCKVCMDCEVSVVFLPCGHLVSCGACGASLTACPLCRAAVRALVRAYLA